MPLACFDAICNVSTPWKHAEGMSLRYGVFERLPYSLLTINHNFQGFFAVKRRAVFILVAKWKALVRGWRRECVVGGMETCFQWRKVAQSLRQMRSIPHCSKAVFNVFVFDSIHNSATMHNLYPEIFHWIVLLFGVGFAEWFDGAVEEVGLLGFAHIAAM